MTELLKCLVMDNLAAESWISFAVFHFYPLESPGKHLVATDQLRKSHLQLSC